MIGEGAAHRLARAAHGVARTLCGIVHGVAAGFRGIVGGMGVVRHCASPVMTSGWYGTNVLPRFFAPLPACADAGGG
ncbi:hypothetical protein WR25_23691 [Diploscapter pachys]|uniref:Uncharacterized protein n=1 Tax=Diploscapter pachys TaxID=2018661 RepID=A0A2A2M2S2_9BILA|nr:hypothetical protein WR25_23691 [Diploscapter pachys]